LFEHFLFLFQPSTEQMKQKQEMLKQREEQLESIMSSILTQGAKTRLDRVKLVKTDKAKLIENAIIRDYEKGIIKNRISEEQLISQYLNLTETTTPTVTIKRKYTDDSDEDLNDDDEF